MINQNLKDRGFRCNHLSIYVTVLNLEQKFFCFFFFNGGRNNTRKLDSPVLKKIKPSCLPSTGSLAHAGEKERSLAQREVKQSRPSQPRRCAQLRALVSKECCLMVYDHCRTRSLDLSVKPVTFLLSEVLARITLTAGIGVHTVSPKVSLERRHRGIYLIEVLNGSPHGSHQICPGSCDLGHMHTDKPEILSNYIPKVQPQIYLPTFVLHHNKIILPCLKLSSTDSTYYKSNLVTEMSCKWALTCRKQRRS